MSGKSSDIKIENSSEEIPTRDRKFSGGVSLLEGSYIESIFAGKYKTPETKAAASPEEEEKDSESVQEDDYDQFEDLEKRSSLESQESEKYEEDLMFDMDSESEGETEDTVEKPQGIVIKPSPKAVTGLKSPTNQNFK